jgi:hypothetical protein
MPDQNHLEKFSSAMVVKIHFGNDEEGVDQTTEIKFFMFINKTITILAHFLGFTQFVFRVPI